MRIFCLIFLWVSAALAMEGAIVPARVKLSSSPIPTVSQSLIEIPHQTLEEPKRNGLTLDEQLTSLANALEEKMPKLNAENKALKQTNSDLEQKLQCLRQYAALCAVGGFALGGSLMLLGVFLRNILKKRQQAQGSSQIKPVTTSLPQPAA